MTETSKIDKSISIILKDIELKGKLVVPQNAIGLVIFSHGSGSSHKSPRNNFVATLLQEKGLATLLFDLLTEEEDRSYENRFNIDLLTERLIKVTKWIQRQPTTKNLPIGYFGASTGAASALKAASALGNDIKAVVSRGGRPDMALEDLTTVKAPTLLVVGSLDQAVITLNEKAYQNLNCPRKLKIIEQATHLFEEPGKLQEVALISSNWFVEHLMPKKIESNVQK